MKQIFLSTREAWREWLRDHHDKEPSGIWLVFYKKGSGKASLACEEAVEEALCYGWIDSVIRSIDHTRYCRKFTPRKDNSQWSEANKRRVKKLLREGRMAQLGLAKVAAAKRLGNWAGNARAQRALELPRELSQALAGRRRAKAFFEGLAPTYQRHFVGWIVSAKRPETRAKRLRESLALLAKGEKLGLK